MAKGKSFEQLVHTIQEALKDNPLTKVSHNMRIISRHGTKRQFDVIIDTVINGYNLRLAIECKDHGRKVEVKDVDAFNSKCESVEGIDRRILISKNGFQKSAILSAKDFRIELEILEEFSADKVFQWLTKHEMYNLSFSINIDKIDVSLEGHIPPRSIEETDLVYDTVNKTWYDYMEYIKGLVRNPGLQQYIKNMIILKWPDLRNTDATSMEFDMELTPKYAFFRFDDKETLIGKIILKLIVEIQEQRVDPDIRAMRNLESKELKAAVLTFPYKDDNSKLQIVVNPKSDKFKSFIINPDDSVEHELKDLALYNPKTGEWTFPKNW